MEYFLRSINVLNLLLAAAVIAAVHFIVFPLAGVKPKITLPAVRLSPAGEEGKKTEHETTARPGDYALIADQNLFSPDRKLTAEKPSEKEKQPQAKPEFVLYGTVITDGMSLAYVDDKKSPVSTPGRGKRVRVLRKGDVLSGFTLKEIDTDRILMARGDEVITVYLMDRGAKDRDSEEKPKMPPPQAAPVRR